MTSRTIEQFLGNQNVVLCIDLLEDRFGKNLKTNDFAAYIYDSMLRFLNSDPNILKMPLVELNKTFLGAVVRGMNSGGMNPGGMNLGGMNLGGMNSTGGTGINTSPGRKYDSNKYDEIMRLRELDAPKKPNEIDFSDNYDAPLENVQELLDRTLKERNIETQSSDTSVIPSLKILDDTVNISHEELPTSRKKKVSFDLFSKLHKITTESSSETQSHADKSLAPVTQLDRIEHKLDLLLKRFPEPPDV